MPIKGRAAPNDGLARVRIHADVFMPQVAVNQSRSEVSTAGLEWTEQGRYYIHEKEFGEIHDLLVRTLYFLFLLE